MSYSSFLREKPILSLSIHFMALLLLLSPFLSGNAPLICQYKGSWYAPAFSPAMTQASMLSSDLQSKADMDYRKLEYDFVIWPLMRQDPHQLQPAAAWQKPMSKDTEGKCYLLGSYDLGRDLFSACLYGFSQSLKLALLALGLSGILGTILGSFAVFQTYRSERISLWSVAFILAGILLIWNETVYVFEFGRASSSHALWCIGLLLFFLIMAYLFAGMKPAIRFPLDRLVLAYVELMKSIPGLLLLLLLVQIFIRPGQWVLAGIIAFLYLPVVMNYSRSFGYKQVNENYIDALKTLGASDSWIYVKHLLPRIALDLLPVLSFGMANVILLEASLRFLGLGIALNEVSLGSILYAARANPSAWWVVLFPGLMLFWMVYSFNALGEYLRNGPSDSKYLGLKE